MKALLFFIGLYASELAMAAVTGHLANDYILIKGKLESKPQGIDLIKSDYRNIFIKHDALLKVNQTDEYNLKRRENFKVKLEDILDVKPGSVKK
jgi:hypothetical protein